MVQHVLIVDDSAPVRRSLTHGPRRCGIDAAAALLPEAGSGIPPAAEDRQLALVPADLEPSLPSAAVRRVPGPIHE